MNTMILLLALLPFAVYWCINEKTGLQLGIIFLLSVWAVSLVKSLRVMYHIDIQFEWIVIAVIFCVYIFFGNRIEAALSKGGFRAFLVAAAVVSFIMILYRPSLEFVLFGGSFIGMCAGYCINKRFIGFKSSDVLQRTGFKKAVVLLARLVLGMTVLILIYYRVENIILNFSESQNINLYGFLCYALMSLWIFIAAPWLFIKLRLAGVRLETTDA